MKKKDRAEWTTEERGKEKENAVGGERKERGR